jgi:hypothetical protein
MAVHHDHGEAIHDLAKDGVAEKLARKTWALATKIGQEIENGRPTPTVVSAEGVHVNG